MSEQEAWLKGITVDDIIALWKKLPDNMIIYSLAFDLANRKIAEDIANYSNLADNGGLFNEIR